MDSNDYKTITVNREFLSEIFLCDVRTVQNFAQLYGMPRDERGEYPLFECLVWFIKKLQKEFDELSKDNPLTRARVEALDLNNQKKIKELEILNGKWLDAELVNFVNVAHVKMLMRNLEAIAPRLNKKINGDSITLALIRDELNDYRNLCADTKINYYEDEIEKMLSENKTD
jgi:phage terminase Nu1 subunit (DNA packaging protein)